MSTPEQQSPPLPVGVTMDRGFALLRHHPRALLLPQLVLNIVPLLFALLLVLIGYFAVGDVATHLEEGRDSTIFGDSTLGVHEVPDFTDGQLATIIVLGLIALVVYVWFVMAATVSVVRGADRALEGREHLKLRPAMCDGLRETPKLFGLGIVFTIAATLVLIGVIIVVYLFSLAAGALAVLVGIAAFAFLIWLGVRVLLWPVVHLSEHAGLGSFKRAFVLSKGRFWVLFGILVLVGIVVMVVSSVVSLLLSLLFSAVSSISDEAGVVAAIPYVIVSSILGVVFTAGFIAPIVVSYRTLAGRDTADLWAAAGAMGAPGPADAPPADPAVRRWDATEAPVAPSSSSGWAAPAAQDPPPTSGAGLGGLPDPGTPSDAEERWGRGSGDPPTS
ncbi:hypothetical protein AB0L40_14405 [Patulibacter sp. NPDC049589]|uniref:hypothetical protein n=1 Tax=Patulibacter sp. NPDC049589 TaxID=3154731 RepID=UPI00344A593E